MSTATTTTARHLNVDRITWVALLVLAALAVATGARVSWDLPSVDTTSTTATAGASVETADHAARVAAAASELDALGQVVRTVPSAAVGLSERIQTLGLVIDGTLPVAAAEPSPATSVVLQQLDPVRTDGVVTARHELAGLREAIRSSPSIAGGVAEEMATLDAIGRGFVPPETMGSGD